MATAAEDLWAETPQQFAGMLERIRANSGASARRLARLAKVPHGSVHRMLDPTREILPTKPDSVRAFVTACGLPDDQIEQVMRIWALLRPQRSVGRAAEQSAPDALVRRVGNIGGPDALIEPALRGDRRAVEALLARIRPVVVKYCRARMGPGERSSADDVAQEVCLAVLKALPSYRRQGRPFMAFVYGIASHKVADAHRAAARIRVEAVPELPDGSGSRPGPEQRALPGELSEQMGQLLSVLPDRQREILVLRIAIGLSAEETADAVGSTPGAVRVAQHRALQRLRKALGEQTESEH